MQVYHRLQVVEEGEKVREEVQEVERESQGEENAQMTCTCGWSERTQTS